MKPPFGRLLTALVTVFDDAGAVDHATTLKVAKHCLRTGSDGLVIAGTTGESPTLTFEEEEALFVYLREKLPGVTLLAGTGSNDTAAAKEHSVLARKIGMDGLLLVNPYYNKPQQEGLYQHFLAVVNAAKLPSLVYNIPGRTSGEVHTGTLLRLAKNKYIVGAKECSGKTDRWITLARHAPDFAVYCGDDSELLTVMANGGVGIIGVASHVAGRPIKEAVTAMADGHLRVAQKAFFPLQPLFQAMYNEVNPVGVKTALEMMGLCSARMRPPLAAAGEDTRKKLRRALKDLGALKKR